MDRRVHDILERIAVGVEQLAVDPEIEIKAGPPVCPSCNVFDPTITLPLQEGATGRMSELVVQAKCQCGENLYIVVESYSVHTDAQKAVEELKERERAGFFQ